MTDTPTTDARDARATEIALKLLHKYEARAIEENPDRTPQEISAQASATARNVTLESIAVLQQSIDLAARVVGCLSFWGGCDTTETLRNDEGSR